MERLPRDILRLLFASFLSHQELCIVVHVWYARSLICLRLCLCVAFDASSTRWAKAVQYVASVKVMQLLGPYKKFRRPRLRSSLEVLDDYVHIFMQLVDVRPENRKASRDSTTERQRHAFLTCVVVAACRQSLVGLVVGNDDLLVLAEGKGRRWGLCVGAKGRGPYNPDAIHCVFRDWRDRGTLKYSKQFLL